VRARVVARQLKSLRLLGPRIGKPDHGGVNNRSQHDISTKGVRHFSLPFRMNLAPGAHFPRAVSGFDLVIEAISFVLNR
jgi:hypothetical protein